ncbi:MAG: acetyl-CoA carboxylase biotin carboxyl carrier protein subunit [Rhodospirillaceae bacterium]|mgnify:CR=1 FL=1|jgi:acetyl-CoA carboxylase biotin carboxyl carrier protein|nr:acetyl-CoA carboxylase biotin carboxyl carrier protein subunit [Rhodospirillaceae bacterium]
MTKEPKGSVDEIKSDLVRHLANILEETDLSEIEYDNGSLRIRVARQGRETAVMMPAPIAPSAAPAAVVESTPDTAPHHPGAVKAPMVGVSFLASEPDTPPFCKVGDSVTEGQTLLLIEAMKTFNPVPAPKAGKVAKILVSDGQPVEFDQPLIIIE